MLLRLIFVRGVHHTHVHHVVQRHHGARPADVGVAHVVRVQAQHEE